MLCGSYGNIFGTEKNCRKYFSVWSRIYTDIFHEYYETNDIEIIDFNITSDLSIQLVDVSLLNNRIKINERIQNLKNDKNKSKPFWKKWLRLSK